MWADLATIPELVSGGYFLTNVLPYWVAFVITLAAIRIIWR